MPHKITPLEAMQAVREAASTRLRRLVPITFDGWKVRGEPFRCWTRPLKLSEHDQIEHATRAAIRRGESGGMARIVETILVRALNEDGSRIFEDDQREELIRVVDADNPSELYTRLEAAELTPQDLDADFTDPRPDSGSESAATSGKP